MRNVRLFNQNDLHQFSREFNLVKITYTNALLIYKKESGLSS